MSGLYSSERGLLLYVRPYARRLVLVGGMMAAASFLMALEPLLFGRLVDRGLIDGDAGALLQTSGLVLLVGVASALLGWYQSVSFAAVGQSMVADVRQALYSALTKWELRVFERFSTGDIVARLEGDVALLEGLITRDAASLLVNTTMIVVAFVLAARIDFALTGLVAPVLPIVYLFQRWVARRVEIDGRLMREAHSELSRFSVESVGFMPTFQAHACGEELSRGYAVRSGSVRATSTRFAGALAMSGAIVSLVMVLTTFAVYVLGGGRVISGSLTTGDLVAFSGYLTMLVGPTMALTGVNLDLSVAKVAWKRLSEILEASSVESSAYQVPGEEHITFDSVSFAYVKGTPVLSGVSFTLRSGESMLLTGPSGAGKTTLTRLLLGQLRPSDGRVLVGGVEAHDCVPEKLRRHVFTVEQDPLLVSDTVRANLCVFGLHASDEALWDALRMVHADGFVRSLGNGLESLLGERGHTLSGGQRQRLALARAVLSDPPVLILDEATSAVDSATEEHIFRSLSSFLRNRTVIVITHRPSASFAPECRLNLGSLPSTEEQQREAS
jgi:ATP-binding cassette, subfamily B, bacterial